MIRVRKSISVICRAGIAVKLKLWGQGKKEISAGLGEYEKLLVYSSV